MDTYTGGHYEYISIRAGWVVVLYLVNKEREKRSKPKTVKILVKRNGV